MTRNVLLTRQSDAIVEQAVGHARQAATLASEVLFGEESDTDSSSAGDTALRVVPLYRFMDSISSSSGPRIAILLGEDRWVSENPLRFGQQTIPADFVEAAKEGNTVQMRTRIGGELLLIVGILAYSSESADMVFFEGGSLQDTADILGILRLVIFVGGAVTLALSATAGVFIVRRSFASIRAFRSAAESIGRGSFEPITEPVDRDFWQLKESFNDMQRSIMKRIEREQRFALEVSHELRSPLTTVVASVELINKRRNELSPEARTALDLLLTEIDRFRQLLLDLLEISRPPESIKLETEVLNVKEFLTEVASRGTHDVPVLTEEGAISLVADAKLLSQIFANLLENASRYAGGATAIHVWSDRDDVLIAVDDAGPGVKQDEREKIFERFTRGEVGAHRRHGLGTGLGLALARERVLLHNGDIWVEDAPSGLGARFIVKLPQYVTTREDAATIERAKQ